MLFYFSVRFTQFTQAYIFLLFSYFVATLQLNVDHMFTITCEFETECKNKTLHNLLNTNNLPIILNSISGELVAGPIVQMTPVKRTLQKKLDGVVGSSCC